MNRREDGRLHPDRIGGPGAAVGDTLVWDGMRWVPGAAGGGDSDHPGTGVSSVQIGPFASADDNSVSVGSAAGTAGADLAVSVGANATASERSVAVGASANAVGQRAVSIGNGTAADGLRAVGVGVAASAFATRSVAIGYGAIVGDDDRGLIKVNDLEIERSDGSGATSIILASPDGTRWRLSVSNAGALVIAAA